MERQRLTDGEQSGHPFSSDTASKAPVGAISLAVGLLVGGMVLLIIGLALYNDPEAHSVALLTLGCICFIPGAYYSWIAYAAWRGRRGYSYADIPSA